MKASIISIGTELLTGRTINTNSAQIAKLLFLNNIEVEYSKSIHDESGQIKNAITESLKECNICILTGGLGPTNDDITKKCLTEYYNDSLVLVENEFKRLDNWFKNRGRKMSEVNRQQAYYPSKSKLFINELGTASGILFEENENIVISLPGVPHEMLHLMETEVLPFLNKKNKISIQTGSIVYRLVNRAESDVFTILESFIDENPELTFAFYPNFMLLDLIIKGPQKKLESIDHDILRKIGTSVYSRSENQSIQQVIGSYLFANKQTLATAESCTGGLVSFMITETPGSSAYFKGSIVSYNNDIKQSELSVSETVLETAGAVSEECVVQMAKNVKSKFNTDYAVSISGIAGPDGGTPEKPVGTVYFGIATPTDVYAVRRELGKGREAIRYRSAQFALYLIWKDFQQS